MKILRIALPALLVSACVGGGGGSGESNQYCHAIPVVSIGCSTCAQVSNTGEAFDGHFATFATMGPGGSGTFDAKTTTQPAGSLAGVFFVPPNPQNTSVTITTFLNGTQQDTQPASFKTATSDGCFGTCSWHNGAASFVGIDTTGNYDEIQVAISNSGAADMRVNEVCVR